MSEATAIDQLNIGSNLSFETTEQAPQLVQGWVSESEEMKKIMRVAENAATSRAPILITGGSGSGKDSLAKWIHARSARSVKAPVIVNCSASGESQLEVELFGAERVGANGVTQTRVGRIESAHGSTLVLNDIHDLDGRIQAKLLKVIQDGTVEKIGSRNPVKVNVRIIATTTRDLKRCVDGGTFRKDLYFRLAVVPLSIPNLKDRREDILPLVQNLVRDYCTAHSKPLMELDGAALQKLQAYAWPGNVRELQNVVSRAVLMSEGDLITADNLLMDQVAEASGAPNEDWKKMTLGDIERMVILDRLKEFSGNRAHSSKALGISIRTLRNKIREYKGLGIDVP